MISLEEELGSRVEAPAHVERLRGALDAKPIQWDHEPHLTSGEMILGTPSYMAPEQVDGEGTADHRADLYALGVAGYELLAGAPPFGALPLAPMLVAHALQPRWPRDETRSRRTGLGMPCGSCGELSSSGPNWTCRWSWPIRESSWREYTPCWIIQTPRSWRPAPPAPSWSDSGPDQACSVAPNTNVVQRHSCRLRCSPDITDLKT